VLTLCSCDNQYIDSQSHTFPATSWSIEEPVMFAFESPDTTAVYDLFLHLRNNQDYQYKNLWMITHIKFPQGKIVTDTLQYPMANAQGEFLGDGRNIVENKLWLKEGIRFRESGTYQLSLNHAMREPGKSQPLQELEGIMNIGYSIEKQKLDGSN
jgi:gliding motility-associated lipoprotein GldH